MADFEALYVLEGILLILNIIISINICRVLSYLYMLFKQNSKKEKLYIYPFNLKKDLSDAVNSYYFIIYCLAFITWSILIIHSENFLRVFFIVILISTGILHITIYPDKNHVRQVYNLHVGYGAGLAYYKNYLEMTLTERFSERIEKFSSENMIKVRTKLFILVPQTCRVYRYLDSVEHGNIERCRELPDEEISHAGIKKRKYNITIYNINGIRMAVEFAQPLKALFLFKEKGLLTDDEMLLQRKIFVQTLKNFLMEDPYKYFEIVEYDDSTETIDEVLTKSYQDFSKSFCDSEIV